MKILET